MEKAILITQCLQNDFVKPIEKFDPLPNALHVGYAESLRLMGEILEEGPVNTVMEWAYSVDPQDLTLIHIRDWHDPADPQQQDHLEQFSPHCLKGSEGAEFVFSQAIKQRNNHHIVNASGLNDFWETDLEGLLAPFSSLGRVKVGIMGVWTEAKIQYLCYEIRTRYPHFEVALCTALCASSTRTMHFIALEQIQSILGVTVLPSVADFTSFLVGSQPDLQRRLNGRIDPSRLKVTDGYTLSPTDQQLALYLFRDCKEVALRGLDGGFSGNRVMKATGVDLHGHKQVPTVLKIGPRPLIARERISFEQIQEVLGNNAPSVVDFAELEDRGAIKYRYAAMLDGTVHCIQDLYEAGLEDGPFFEHLERVFGHQLGRLYEAETLERINLLKYYDFDPKWTPGVASRVADILGRKASEVKGENLDLVVPGAPKLVLENPVQFYSQHLKSLVGETMRPHYMAFVHGDLNGKNILVDAQGNVWIIDFFGTHKGHVIRDLVKFENDLLYIFTKIEGVEEWKEALTLTDLILDISDLGAELDPNLEAQFTHSHLRRAFRSVRKLRSFYARLIQLDRSPHQLHIAALRYAVHTMGFEECSLWQKRWAMYAASKCIRLILDSHTASTQLRIDFLPKELTGGTNLGLTILPGRKDRGRDLTTDLAQMKTVGIKSVLCLLTENEFEKYGLKNLKKAYLKAGFNLHHLPILDQGTPTLGGYKEAEEWLSLQLAKGHHTAIHCVGGLGRSGLVAAAFLKRRCGLEGSEAIRIVRQTRSPRALETRAQENFVLNLKVEE